MRSQLFEASAFLALFLPSRLFFPIPFDNVQFIDGAIKRALWDWDLTSRKEIEEEIETSYSEKRNIFQVVGELSLAYSLENMGRSSYFNPTFLTISEPLENGASFRSVSAAFAWLWQSEKKAILNALYHQTEAPTLGFKARQVYQDIRGLASKLHQGNQNYLNAFSEYTAKKTSSPIPDRQRPASALPYPKRSASFSCKSGNGHGFECCIFTIFVLKTAISG